MLKKYLGDYSSPRKISGLNCDPAMALGLEEPTKKNKKAKHCTVSFLFLWVSNPQIQ